ncbi:MAG: HEAT repeat domain-containing protein [Planctomycetota bacterium]
MGVLRGVGAGVGLRRIVGAFALALCFGIASAQEPLQEAFSGEPSALELRRRLAGLPATELPRLFRLAVEARLVLPQADTFLPLDDEQLAAVRAALCARSRRELLPFFEELARGPLELRERLEAHLVLGAVGESENLRLLLRLSVNPGESAPPFELRTSFTAALAAILWRAPAAIEQVPGLFTDSPPVFTAPVVEALAQCAGRRATEILAQLLGRVPGIDGLLLARLAQRGRYTGSSAEFVFATLRRYFHQTDPALVAAAVRASAELGDDGAVDELIGLLEHRDERVCAGAVDALTELSGLDFGSDVARWTGWYHAEMHWWEHEADARLVRIERAHGPEYVRAAREVLEHRLFRARLAESFAQALERRDADEAWLACRALAELRSMVAVPALIECLERDDPRLRAAAHAALRAITGAELGPEPEAWLQLAG